MKLSSQKILAGLVGVATILTLVVSAVTPAAAQVTTTTTSSTSATFTRNLTIGSTGADVTALQQWLAVKGFFTVTPTGYFGPITQKALASFQASVGISPAAGYFGPITMAYIAANAGVTTTTTTTSTVPGCAAGAMFSATTGAPCASSSSVPGCAAGAMFSATTGAPCTTTATTLPAGCTTASGFSSTTGQACVATATSVTGNGVLTVTQDPTVVTNTNITNYTNVPIYGLQLQAQLGSVNVSQLTLAVTDYNSTATTYENPGAFITSLSVVDPSTNTVIYTEPVTPANFIVNPSSSTNFYVQLSGFNFSVPANSTKDLIVEANVSSTIDQTRVLTVAGYGSNSLQYFTGNNIVNYQQISGISINSTFQTSNSTSVIFGIDASNPTASTQYVNSSSGAQGVTLLAFNAQSSSGSVNLTNLTAAVNSTATAPTAVYLYNGSTLLSAVSPTTTSGGVTVTFNNFNDQVTSGTTKVFTIRADFPSNTTAGTVASGVLNTITYSTAGGQITTTANQNLTGNNQTFYAASANLQIISTPTASETQGVQGVSSSTLTAVFPLKVTPEPGQEVQPLATDFQVCVIPSTSNISTLNVCTSAGAYVTPFISSPITPTPSSTVAPLSQGTTYTFSLSATAPTTLAKNVAYTFYLTRASTTVQSITGVPVTQVLGTTTIANNQSQAVLYQ